MFEQQPMQGYGGWGVNAPYMTPAYMANFRPSYNEGDNGYNPYAANYSIAESAWTLGPGDIPFGGDAYQTLGAHQYNITTGASDAAAWGAQNLAIPAAAWYASNKLLTSGSGRFGAGGMAGAMGRGMGRGAAGATARMGSGLMGRIGMGGVASGLGRMGAGTAFRGAAGLAGGLAGSMFLPLAAAQAAGSVANASFVDPYIATRRGMDAMMSNTANTFVAGGGGAASGGFGMSAARSQEISQALTVAGQEDFSELGGMEYNEIADNMMRSGMFQEIGDMDADRIVDGVKKATGVLKLITRITGDPDIQAGVDTLAKLKAGGLDDIGEMGRVLQQIKNASAASGISVNQIIDTIGNQGMVMAQQQGMRGVTGLTASADAYAGFENARKSGLISGAQMQALGGSEGMTQNMMSGAMTMMNSPMGRMIMQGNGQWGGGLTGNIAGWGGQFSGDPMRSQGDWFANQGTYKDEALNEVGAKRMMLDSLKSMAKSMGRDPDDGAVLASMAEAAGLSPQEFRSMAEADRASQDPLSRMRMGEARDTAAASDEASRRMQEGIGMIGVAGIGEAQLAYRRIKSQLAGGAAASTSGITETIAQASDWFDEMLTKSKGQETAYDQGNKVAVLDEEGNIMGSQEIFLESHELRNIGVNQRTGEEVFDLQKDPKHNSLIARLNTVANNTGTPPSVKKDIDRAYKYLLKGDYENAVNMFRKIDSKTQGILSGNTEDHEVVERDDWANELLKSLNNGEIQASASKVKAKVSKNADEDFRDKIKQIGAIGETAEQDAAEFSKVFMNDELHNEDTYRALGLDPKKMEGLDKAGRMRAMRDAAAGISNRDVEVTEDSFVDELQSRSGLTEDQVDSYMKSTKNDVTDWIKEVNGAVDSSEELDRISRKAQEWVNNDPTKDAGSTTDWSFLKDVGSVTEANTTATMALTEALVAKYNQDKGMFADELTIEGIGSKLNINKAK